MEVLDAIHAFALRIPLVGHYLVLTTFALFVWSLMFLRRDTVPRGFVWMVRASWAAFAVNALPGLVLWAVGRKVPSAVAAPGSELTTVGFPPDPSRHWEHVMYGAFVLVSLYAVEIILAGKVVQQPRALRFIPLATFFALCVAYRAVQVAYVPGASPGT